MKGQKLEKKKDIFCGYINYNIILCEVQHRWRRSEEVICKNPELFRIKDFWVGTVRSRFVPTAPSRLGKTFVLPTSQFQNAIARFGLLRRTPPTKVGYVQTHKPLPPELKKPPYWVV